MRQEAYRRLDLTGRVIIVTGGASGFGKETAKLLAGRGAAVAVSDLNDVGGEQVVDAIQRTGGKAIYIHADVSREVDVAALVDTTVKQFGGLHGAFNNAGFLNRGCTADVDIADWQKTIDIDLTGVFLCMKHEIAYMVKNAGGSIVNTTSAAGLVGQQNACAYIASKHGVVGLTRSAAADYSAKGIRVNAIAPGIFVTPMSESMRADPAIEKQLMGMHPIGRLGQPVEIAEAAAWLLSEASSFVTGTILSVDGGFVSV